jgi:hypothetical protein
LLNLSNCDERAKRGAENERQRFGGGYTAAGVDRWLTITSCTCNSAAALLLPLRVVCFTWICSVLYCIIFIYGVLILLAVLCIASRHNLSAYVGKSNQGRRTISGPIRGLRTYTALGPRTTTSFLPDPRVPLIM